MYFQLLCNKEAQEEFLRVTDQVMKEWYGEGDIQKFPDLPRIVNKRHFLRIKKLLDGTKGTIVYGGKTDEADLWIEPTIVGEQVAFIISTLFRIAS